MDIKRARMAACMSQEDLARASSLSRATIARYEAGQREPTLTVAAKIAEALGCTINDLIEHKDGQ